jgi:hypothetical protein
MKFLMSSSLKLRLLKPALALLLAISCSSEDGESRPAIKLVEEGYCQVHQTLMGVAFMPGWTRTVESQVGFFPNVAVMDNDVHIRANPESSSSMSYLSSCSKCELGSAGISTPAELDSVGFHRPDELEEACRLHEIQLTWVFSRPLSRPFDGWGEVLEEYMPNNAPYGGGEYSSPGPVEGWCWLSYCHVCFGRTGELLVENYGGGGYH